MGKGQFVKQHFVLIVGVSLPVLLVVLFGVATVIPKLLVAPPQHDLIFSTTHYDHNALPKGTLRFDVQDGKLRGVFYESNNNRQVPRLYCFDVQTESTREISVDIPPNIEFGQTVEIPEVAAYKISKGTLSPDGYTFDNSYRGRHGFLFSGGSRYHAKIEKDGRAMKIPGVGNRYFGDVQFLGWVIEVEDETRDAVSDVSGE